MSPRERFQNGLARFMALSPRERWLAALAVAAAIYWLGEQTLLEPQRQAIQAAQARAATQAKELADLHAAIAARLDAQAAARAAQEGNLAALAALKAPIGELSAMLEPASTAGPSSLGQLLRHMAAGHPELTLLSLRTLPTTAFYAHPSAADGRPAAGGNPLPQAIYRHGVELSVRGRYPDLVAFLEQLQARSARIFWSEVRLDANYPEAVLKVTVNALSERAEAGLY